MFVALDQVNVLHRGFQVFVSHQFFDRSDVDACGRKPCPEGVAPMPSSA
jgi:hypothetical protein